MTLLLRSSLRQPRPLLSAPWGDPDLRFCHIPSLGCTRCSLSDGLDKLRMLPLLQDYMGLWYPAPIERIGKGIPCEALQLAP